MKTIYISIGNSDDKLTQREWSEFHQTVSATLNMASQEMHGQWTSHPTSPWQNACWCLVFKDEATERRVKVWLQGLAHRYRQDSIAWAEATTEFLEP